jgi:hypothetical protein
MVISIQSRASPSLVVDETRRRSKAEEHGIPALTHLNFEQQVKGRTRRWNSKLAWQKHSLELDNIPSHAFILILSLFHDRQSVSPAAGTLRGCWLLRQTSVDACLINDRNSPRSRETVTT